MMILTGVVAPVRQWRMPEKLEVRSEPDEDPGQPG